MSNILKSTKNTSLPLYTAPSSSPKMNKPVYTCCFFATFLHCIIIALSIPIFFDYFYRLCYRVTHFIKEKNLGSGQELKSIAWEALCILDLMVTMVTLLSIYLTSGKAITTPQFLHRDRKNVLHVLIPFYALHYLPNLNKLYAFTRSHRHIDVNNLDISTIWHVTSQEERHSILLFRSI